MSFLWTEVKAAQTNQRIIPFAINSSDTLQIVQKTAHDSWVSRDKGLHLVGSMISTIAVSKISQTFYAKSHSESIKIGIGFTFGLGLGKELWDSTKKNNKFSYKDLTADIIGIIIGSAILNFE